MTSKNDNKQIDYWRVIHDTAELTETTLKRIIQLTHNEPNYHSIQLAVENFKEGEYKRIACAIPISQLNRDRVGIRISPIENAGYKNLLQIKDISYQQLLAIPGIGKSNASLILNSVNKLDLEVKSSIVVDPENRSNKQMGDIILECYKYSNLSYLCNMLKDVLNPIEKQLQEYYKVLCEANSRFSWFWIVSKRHRCEIYNTAIKVNKLLSGNLHDYLQLASEKKEAILKANTSTAWDDYEKKKEQYSKCISSYTPVSENSSMYNLPQITDGNINNGSFDILPNRSYGGIAAIASLLVLSFLIFFSIFQAETIKKENYSNGISYATTADYKKAKEVFESIQEYRDAKIWLTFCDYAEKYSISNSYIGGEEELANLTFAYDTQYQGLINGLHTSVEKLADIKRQQDYERLLQQHPEYAVPKSEIHISIPYKTHYVSGVLEYGVNIDNETDYDIVITEISISPTIQGNEKGKSVYVNIPVDAHASISTSIDIGSGQKRKGGSMTSKGTVYGDPAYYCSSFNIKLKN